MGAPLQRDQSRARNRGRELTAKVVRNRPIRPPVQNERRRLHVLELTSNVVAVDQLQQLRDCLSACRGTLEPREPPCSTLPTSPRKMSASTRDPRPQCERTAATIASRTSGGAIEPPSTAWSVPISLSNVSSSSPTLEAAEELREDALAAILDAARRTTRGVILRIR